MAKGYSVERRGKMFRAYVRYKKSVCQKSFQRKTAADAWGRAQVKAIDDGVFNKQERRYQNMTLVDALNEYIETLEKRATMGEVDPLGTCQMSLKY